MKSNTLAAFALVGVVGISGGALYYKHQGANEQSTETAYGEQEEIISAEKVQEMLEYSAFYDIQKHLNGLTRLAIIDESQAEIVNNALLDHMNKNMSYFEQIGSDEKYQRSSYWGYRSGENQFGIDFFATLPENLQEFLSTHLSAINGCETSREILQEFSIVNAECNDNDNVTLVKLDRNGEGVSVTYDFTNEAVYFEKEGYRENEFSTIPLTEASQGYNQARDAAQAIEESIPENISAYQEKMALLWTAALADIEAMEGAPLLEIKTPEVLGEAPEI